MFTYERFESVTHMDEYLDYLLHYPKNFSEEKNYPLLIYIHGAGSLGDDITKLNHVGPLLEVEKGRNLSCIVIAPQCHATTWFDVFECLQEFIDIWRHKKNVDINRVYVCGASMGGYTTWQMAMTHPDWFAAAVPVCGGGMYWNAGRLKNLPIWAFHGAKDNTVLVEESQKMVNAVNNCGGYAKLTIFPDVQHDSWVDAFDNDELYEWLFTQQHK